MDFRIFTFYGNKIAGYLGASLTSKWLNFDGQRALVSLQWTRHVQSWPCSRLQKGPAQQASQLEKRQSR